MPSNHADVVQRHAVGLDTSSLLGLLALPVRVAWELRAEGCGLLERPNGGENTVAFNNRIYSVSRVVYRDGTLVKILGDAGVGGANRPQWVDEGPLNHPPDRYVDPFDPALLSGSAPGPTPQPQPQPGQPSNLDARVAALEDTVLRLEGAIAMSIKSGAHVSLRSENSHYLSAELGGGGEVNARPTAANVWEDFVVEVR